jgi:ectoine hydroxylase-related dioxygenase (phytanoyl-CoA dioxygenase family)
MTTQFYTASTTDYGEHEEAMAAYLEKGTQRALALENRGPIRFTESGDLHPDIVEAYSRCGFYVFEGVIDAAELADIERDVVDMWQRAPTEKGAAVDKLGRPALAADCKAPVLSWVRPLSDPIGGTDHAHGRHPAKMIEPQAPADAPSHILQLVLGSLQFSDACLRLYAHPDLLRVAAAIHGDDFVPFNEAVWLKHPGLGGSVAWHQDGWTHWDSSDLDENTHGFNFMAQLYGCNAANGLWVLPGSHRVGRVDIKSMVETEGSDRLVDAVPMICAPGDVGICNRQAVHGSFANTSPDMRVTINFGFHRRSSVLGVESGGVHNEISVYDSERIHQRAKMIGYGINARHEYFPAEQSYEYQPLREEMAQLQFNSAARREIKDYNLLDLGI